MAIFKITVDTETKTLEVEHDGKSMGDNIQYVCVNKYPDYDNPGKFVVGVNVSERSVTQDGVTKTLNISAEKAYVQETVSDFLRKSI
jgi:hypothetical protein